MYMKIVLNICIHLEYGAEITSESEVIVTIGWIYIKVTLILKLWEILDVKMYRI